nr:unnamed protein product [Callosobruchus chinensis]
MDSPEECSSSDEQDIKSIILPSVSPTLNPHDINSKAISYNLSPSLVGGSKQWTVNRKSAFLPYRHQNKCNTTVLTNLQRGNTQAQNPLPQISDVNFHAKAGQGELTQQDVDNEPSVDIRDKHNMTALHWACHYGQVSTVQLLLNCGANVNLLGPEEESPLHLAASGGHHEITRMLIKAGADVNHVDHMCNTALMYAAKGNHPHTCQELLLNGADCSLVNLNDDTAHTIAIDNNSILAKTVIRKHLISRFEARSTSPTDSTSTEQDIKS